MGINNSASFDKAWSLLKEEITDMVEYPPGSQNFVPRAKPASPASLGKPKCNEGEIDSLRLR
jgi:hypothetical protein